MNGFTKQEKAVIIVGIVADASLQAVMDNMIGIKRDKVILLHPMNIPYVQIPIQKERAAHQGQEAVNIDQNNEWRGDNKMIRSTRRSLPFEENALGLLMLQNGP